MSDPTALARLARLLVRRAGGALLCHLGVSQTSLFATW